MDKCQQFIYKVSELRFLQIKERQVNKFNRLLLKKQRNITWFSTVPLVNPQAGVLAPRWLAPLSPKQVVPGKTMLLGQPVPLPCKQLVLRQSALALPRWRALIPRWSAPLSSRQLVPRKTALLRQPALLPHKQLALRQSALLRQ